MQYQSTIEICLLQSCEMAIERIRDELDIASRPALIIYVYKTGHCEGLDLIEKVSEPYKDSD